MFCLVMTGRNVVSNLQPPSYSDLELRIKQLETELSMAVQLSGRYESKNRICNNLMDERASFASKLYAHGLRLDPDGNLYPISMPTDDVVVRFDDKTGEDRDVATFYEMTQALREVANKYNYDLKQWGSGESFLKYAAMQLEMNKKWEQDGTI